MASHMADDADDASEMSSPEDETLLPKAECGSRAMLSKSDRRRRLSIAALALAALFGWFAYLTVRYLPLGGGLRKISSRQLTVRGLLESEELSGLAAKNLLALSPEGLAPLGQEGLRAEVARRLQSISDDIRAKYPEVHEELGSLQLTVQQKEGALRMVRKYGDSRMIDISNDIAQVVAENRQANGDHESLKRRLTNKLGPKFGMIQQLGEEMLPGNKLTFDMGQELPAMAGWHPEIEVDLSKPAERLLSEEANPVVEGITAGVRAQTHTLFKSLHAELVETMPEAHVRKLLSLFDDPDSSSSGSSSGGHDQSFMACISSAVPNPVAVCKCIADNMKEVLQMMSSFVKAKR
mmetsp:Transcript_35658/g.101640  ORF Transcript_35658/g.101640 Transcript_35658/m.101640 type:complete len:351 (-) Transcript_35658:161-1213(-)